MLVAAFAGVMRLAGRLWGAGEDTGVESSRVLTAAHLDRLGPAMSGAPVRE